MRLYRSFGTVALHTIGSRIFGFFRTMMMASFLGPGPITDALTMATKFPAVLRRIFAEGAFNAVFVPMYTRELSTHGKKSAHALAQDIFNILFTTLIILVMVAEVYMENIVTFLLPGFVSTPERLMHTILFTRITFPFILFISLCAFYSGILNSHQRFSAVASSPTLGNIAIIVVFLGLYPFMENKGVPMAIGILACGIVQWAWVWFPAHKLNISLTPRRPHITPTVKKFFRKIIPALAGGGVVQINILVGAMIASNLPNDRVSYLEFAERLNQLPLSVIGTAISTAMLPTLVRQFKNADITHALNTQNKALELVLFLTLPAAVGLFCLADVIVTVLFEHGKFLASDTAATAGALRMMAVGLPAYILVKLLTTSFFANEDTRTPLTTGALSIILDIALSLALIGRYEHIGIAVATALASWANTLMLFMILCSRKQFLISKALRLFIARILVISFGFAGFLVLLKSIITGWQDTWIIHQIIALSAFLILGIGFYALLCHKSGTYDVLLFYKQFTRKGAE
ncbi:MAG: murein biosynthesis integral membrane protein MurJ [Alphaproteobacteria bacterium]|nr:MAG: murein biosynthesis integral membrane protein MurJ [Alphaproteobacteria bacterium]